MYYKNLFPEHNFQSKLNTKPDPYGLFPCFHQQTHVALTVINVIITLPLAVNFYR